MILYTFFSNLLQICFLPKFSTVSSVEPKILSQILTELTNIASKNFNEIIQRAKVEAEGVTIVKDNQSFVLIDQEELEALIETAELLQTPNILEDVSQARKEYQQQETLTMEDIFGSTTLTYSLSVVEGAGLCLNSTAVLNISEGI